MSNEYEMRLRDTEMQHRKALMMCNISNALTKVGGSATITDAVISFIETCARNGIRLSSTITTGPYAQKMLDDGSNDYS